MSKKGKMRSSNEIAVLREAIVKITRILAGNGLKVTQRGTEAFVRSDHRGRPIQVNLPYIPDNASEELVMAIQGFLDHEVGHLLFSDFNVIVEAFKQGGSIASMHNILEDPRVEREMIKRFRGSSYNLEKVQRFFLERFTHPKVEEAMAGGDMKALFSSLFVPMVRAWAGQKVFQDYMTDKWVHVQPIVDRIGEDLIKRIPTLKSTAEALEVTLEIGKRIREPKLPTPPSAGGDDPEESEGEGDGEAEKEREPDPDEPEESDDGESEETDRSRDGEDEAEPDSDEEEEPEEESEGDDSDEDGPAEEEPGEGESEGDDSDDLEEEKGADDFDEGDGHGKEEDEDFDLDPESPSSSKVDEGAESEDGPAAGGKSEVDEEESDGEPVDEPEEELDGEEEEPAADSDETLEMDLPEFLDAMAGSDFDSAVSTEITRDVVDALRISDYRVFTTDEDTCEPLDASHIRDDAINRLIESTQAMVGPLSKQVERLVLAQSSARWVPGQRRGRINSAALHRIKTGDTRVFRTRDVRETKETAVELLVDCSGSMSGPRIKVATEAAFALSNVLTRLNVANEVLGFTTKYHSHEVSRQMREEAAKHYIRAYSRTEALYLPILKGFNEPLNVEQKRRFAMVRDQGITLQQNVDGECVEIAARRLLTRPEAGKVLIVLSDGEPACPGNMHEQDAHLRRVVPMIESWGVRTIGLGIQTRSVERFYRNNAVINNLEELPERLMNILKTILIAA